MTFMFRTDGSVNRAGWKALLSTFQSCTSRTLAFSGSPTTVAMGSTINCVPTPSAGSGTITYSSSNTAVATVNSSGIATGVGVGTATITATIAGDGVYCSTTATHTVNVTVPVPTITQAVEPLPRCGTENAVLTASLSGVAVPTGYAFYWYSNAACTAEITSGVSGTINNTLTYPANENTTVYCRLEKRVAGTTTVPQTFSYTDNNMYTYTVPEGATSLTLEVWGAQGGSYNTSYSGGLGGYSKGTLNNPTAGSTLYVVVGGQPTANTSTPTAYNSSATISGGYNGGGSTIVHYYKNSDSQYGWSLPQGGGGATHIATVSGVLSSLSSQQDNVLIVAGGGSGGIYCYGTGDVGLSGYAGFSGYAGGGSTSNAYSSTYQATQSGAGTNGSFGQGGSHTGGYNYRYGTAGGGGGWYGGGCNSHSDTYSEELVHGHGGGSGYIKSTLTSTSSTNGSRSGNGQAKITASIPTINVESASTAANITIQCFTCNEPSGTFAISGSATPSLGTDQTATLTVSNTTGYAVSWSSGNTSIVTVSGSGNSATITGHNLGTTTVRLPSRPATPPSARWNLFIM